MRKSILVAVIALACVQAVNAKKPDQREGRAEEAYKQCISYLHDNAKNPDSFTAEGTYRFKLANWATTYRGGRNQIIIYTNARGMNTYGAVLSHSYTCWVECSPDKPCEMVGQQEEN